MALQPAGRVRKVDNFPLPDYRPGRFYSMRTGAPDRLDARLEQRFKRMEIEAMTRAAGLTSIRFQAGSRA